VLEAGIPVVEFDQHDDDIAARVEPRIGQIANLNVAENVDKPPRTSISPIVAASAAITRPAPNSQTLAVAQAWLPVCQTMRSATKAETKKAIGKGTSMGWMGWPAMLAVLRGLAMGYSEMELWEISPR